MRAFTLSVTLSKVTPQPLSGAPRLSVCVLDGLSRAPGSAHPVMTLTGILARCSGCSLGLTCPWSVGRAVCGVVGSILSPPRSPHLLNDYGSDPDSQPVVSLLRISPYIQAAGHRTVPSPPAVCSLVSEPAPHAHTHVHSHSHRHTRAHTRSNTHMCTHLQHGPTLTLHTFSCERTHTYVYLTCMYMCTSYTDTFHIHARVPHTDHTPVHTHSSDINTDHTRVHTSAGCKHVHTNKSTHVTGTSPHKCCPHTYHTHVDTRVHGAPLSYICRT